MIPVNQNSYEIDPFERVIGSSRLCVIIFAYGVVKCLSGKTLRAILTFGRSAKTSTVISAEPPNGREVERFR